MISRPPDDDREQGAFVAVSDLTVPLEGRTALVDAFRARLGAVERAPGFQRLEVWADENEATAFTLVAWWDSQADFVAYMRSAAHRASHDRIPTGDQAPRARRFRRFTIVAT